jgi:hypothetical protein
VTKKRTASKRSKTQNIIRPSRHGRTIEKHISKMNEIHPELRKLVNTFLTERDIPLKVHVMHFTSKATKESKCCYINGKVVCGPPCF